MVMVSGSRVPRNGKPRVVPGSQEREASSGPGFPGTGTLEWFRVPGTGTRNLHTYKAHCISFNEECTTRMMNILDLGS